MISVTISIYMNVCIYASMCVHAYILCTCIYPHMYMQIWMHVLLCFSLFHTFKTGSKFSSYSPSYSLGRRILNPHITFLPLECSVELPGLGILSDLKCRKAVISKFPLSLFEHQWADDFMMTSPSLQAGSLWALPISQGELCLSEKAHMILTTQEETPPLRVLACLGKGSQKW